MFRQWLIRTLPLGLLTLCVVAWVGSYFWSVVSIDKDGPEGSSWSIEWGYLRASTYTNSGNPDPIHLIIFHPVSPAGIRQEYSTLKYRLAGFAYQNDSHGGKKFWRAYVPMWFPTLLLSALLLYVWRKTRHKPKVTGLPIEVVHPAS